MENKELSNKETVSRSPVTIGSAWLPVHAASDLPRDCVLLWVFVEPPFDNPGVRLMKWIDGQLWTCDDKSGKVSWAFEYIKAVSPIYEPPPYLHV